MNLEQYMKIAIEEAQISLREENHGFGAVIVKDGKVVASAHDQENTDNDSTSHAAVNAIRAASKELGKELSGCILLSTQVHTTVSIFFLRLLSKFKRFKQKLPNRYQPMR